MSAASLKHLENCFSQPAAARKRKSFREMGLWPMPEVTDADIQNMIENSTLGLYWRVRQGGIG
jgi:hypothetical protein